MKRYLSILVSLARYGLAQLLEYRVNFVIYSLLSIFWAFFFIFTAGLILGHVDSIGGWSKNEVLLLTATNTLFSSLLWFFVFPSLNEFSELIRKGNLDFSLTKPVNSRFLISIHRFDFNPFVRIVFIILFIANIAGSLSQNIGLGQIAIYWLMLCLGMIIFYNLFYSITVLNIWFVSIFNLEYFFSSVMETGRYPLNIYKNVFGIIFSFFIPIGFIATFPVQALLGRLSFVNVLFAIFLVIISSILSQYFWNFALKRYSSASS